MSTKWLGIIGGAGLAVGAAVDANGALIVIDDFAGGPDLVSLSSFAPPELATGTFIHGGAVGGNRDVFVQSQSMGSFQSGVAFGLGGYASFSGSGSGGIFWDGSAGPVDGDSDGTISVADFEFGLTLDIVGNSPNPVIQLTARADLAGGAVDLIFANSSTDYAVYTIPLTTVGAFDDYFVDVGTPTSVVGAYDPLTLKAVGMFVNGLGVPDLDVQVSLLAVDVPGLIIPESGTWVAMAGLVGIAGLGVRRARAARQS